MSHTPSSSGNGVRVYTRGFTLVELLISIAIIGIITGIVMVKYSSFDSTVLLKSTAYEIALALRDAQVRSVGAMRSESGSFDYPQGITFSAGAAGGKSYTAFLFTSETATPYYDSPLAQDVRETKIGRSMYINDVCVTVGGVDSCSTDGSIDRLDISFRRPEFKALFYGAESDGSSFSSAITGAKIKVGSDTGSNIFVVEVTKLGQISVYKQ